MRAIKIYSKKVDKCADGRKRTPYYHAIWFHGNILFRKGFIKPWFNITDAAFHFLGFRFTKGIITK